MSIDQRAAETPPQIVDPFNIGNPPPAPPPAKPRNPDGTFAQSGTPSPQPTALPQWMIEDAFELGVPEADMAAMGPDALGRLCRHLRRQQQEFRQQNNRAQAADFAPAQPAPRQQQQSEDPWADFKFEEVHPSIARVLKAQQDEIARLKGLETDFRQDREQRVQSERQQSQDVIDDGFAWLVEKLGPIGEQLYGKQPGRMMNMESPEWKRRLSCLHCGGVDVSKVNSGRIQSQLTKGHQALALFVPANGNGNGQQPNPYAQGQGQQQANTRFTPEQWAQGGLNMPTDRQDVPMPDGTDKAVMNLTARLNETRGQQAIKNLGLFPG